MFVEAEINAGLWDSLFGRRPASLGYYPRPGIRVPPSTTKMVTVTEGSGMDVRVDAGVRA